MPSARRSRARERGSWRVAIRGLERSPELGHPWITDALRLDPTEPGADGQGVSMSMTRSVFRARPLADDELVARARTGDAAAYSELWRRHSAAGLAAARSFSRLEDPEDLVSEAFAQILHAIRTGGGPRGAFRPYLYTVIRNLAVRSLRQRRDIADAEPDTLVGSASPEESITELLDHGMTAAAFRSLPERWQAVLWYTEVERMTPAEAAVLMGMRPNAVSALAYRARIALRAAWLQAHISAEEEDEECRFTLSHLGEYAQGTLAARARRRVSAHLETCARCGSVSEEVGEVAGRLTVVLLPLLLGATAGGVLASAIAAPAPPASAAVAGAAGWGIGSAGGGSAGGGSAGGGSAAGGGSTGGAATGGAATGGAATGGAAAGGASVASGVSTGLLVGAAVVAAVAVGVGAAVALPGVLGRGPVASTSSPAAEGGAPHGGGRGGPAGSSVSTPEPHAAEPSVPPPAAPDETAPPAVPRRPATPPSRHEAVAPVLPSSPPVVVAPPEPPSPPDPPELPDPPALPAPRLNAPASLLTRHTTVSVSGTATVGATVLVSAGDASLGSATARADGTWTWTSPLFADGTVELRFVQQLDGWSPSSATVLVLTVDTHADAPVARASGTTPTSLVAPSLSGTAEPGAQVAVEDGAGTQLATVVADADGAWSTGALEGMTPDTRWLSVTQTDPAGNRSSPASVGPFGFVPVISSPQQGEVVPRGPVVIDISGWASATAHVVARLDGADFPLEVDPGGRQVRLVQGSGGDPSPGRYTVQFAYSDARGHVDAGAPWYTLSFTVSAR